MADLELQEDELDSLQYIITDIEIKRKYTDAGETFCVVPFSALNDVVSLEITLPLSYPTEQPVIVVPECQIGPLGFDQKKAAKKQPKLLAVAQRAIDDAVNLFTPGLGMIYDVYSSVQVVVEQFIENSKQPKSTKPKIQAPTRELEIRQSDPIVVMKSKFIAFSCRVYSPSDFTAFWDAITTQPRHADVTHHIAAYIMGDEKDSFYDDDGEHGGSIGMLKMLLDMKKRNLAIIVARWYGGKKLGPQRFRIINNMAKEAIQLWDD
ncbi:hypothetical protein J8273_4426 [Carpediemonas membranifera]|uniref:RWD domain-containing protein n=1 Tax=Carpediemonas membranifera TaxID=201153 RepID=A0A8J6ATY5_9EUKA|nr:hypothetical protein J8273_4426 [Carpediemonas membranifera]|eukprot:KAG9394063.1 hypothetical protein J8273_4426 [Carpediemonas membranifera]